MYDIYGLHDIAGMDEPTPVTEELVLGNLNRLAEFQDRGITFDYYYIDAGWSDPFGDLREFDPDYFPTGPGRIVERVRELGMKFGLWLSPASGPMAFRPESEAPFLARCGTLPSTSENARKPRGALCMAADTWRATFQEALLHHVRENNVYGFKLDGNVFFCSNPQHDHLPGKYSTEPMMDAMIDVLETVRQERPEIMFMF